MQILVCTTQLKYFLAEYLQNKRFLAANRGVNLHTGMKKFQQHGPPYGSQVVRSKRTSTRKSKSQHQNFDWMVRLWNFSHIFWKIQPESLCVKWVPHFDPYPYPYINKYTSPENFERPDFARCFSAFLRGLAASIWAGRPRISSQEDGLM